MTTRTVREYPGDADVTVGSRDIASARRRVLLAGAIGTAIEWYDFFIYGLIAPLVFDQLFSRSSIS